MQLEHRVELILLGKSQLEVNAFDFQAKTVDTFSIFKIVYNDVDLGESQLQLENWAIC